MKSYYPLFLFFILGFFSAGCTAQSTFNYKKKWDEVEQSLKKDGLPKTALTQVEAIYQQAIKDNNDPERIKSFLYKMELRNQITEDNANERFAALEKEIANAQHPTKSVLQSMGAELYQRFYNNTRWKLHDRTTTVNFQKEDIETWSAADFAQKIAALYLSSVAEKKILQSTPVSQYDTIVLKGNSRHLRPTLYDLLIHRAIDYFRYEDRILTKPVYAFQLEDPKIFAPAEEFVQLAPVTEDSAAYHLQALKLFQDLLKFRLQEGDTAALVDADLHRLEFMEEHAVVEDKSDLYRRALEAITQKFGNIPAASMAWYQLASWHADQAREYDPLTDTTNRYSYLPALEIIRQLIAQITPSEGRQNAQNLYDAIMQKTLSLSAEKVNEPSKPFRILAEHRNSGNLFLRIFPITREERQRFKLKSWEIDSWGLLTAKKAVWEKKFSLPDTKDHQTHRTEIPVDALPIGSYAILSSTDGNFSLDGKDPLTLSFIHISGLAHVNFTNDYYIVDRSLGTPVSNALVQVWSINYDRNERVNNLVKEESYTTNKAGHFKLKQRDNKSRNAQLYFQLSSGKDSLFLDDDAQNYTFPVARSQQSYTREQYEKANQRLFLFTDRAIYRPGQTVMFKGLVVTRDFSDGKYRIIDGFRSALSLRDANGQQIDSVHLVSDEDGSFHGGFKIPTNLLTGRFTIRDPRINGQVSIAVEEYKRPKYFIDVKPEKTSYLVNDSIRFIGEVTGFAGNAMSNTRLTYRVVRKSRFPFSIFGYNRGWLPFPMEETQLANGEIITDVNGKFEVVVKAIADKKISRDKNPNFIYELEVESTDISGEASFANSSAIAGYRSILLHIEAPERMKNPDLAGVKVLATNLAGEAQTVLAETRIAKLQSPDKIFRERLWIQPDQFIIDQQKFYSLFPHDLYADENNPENWKEINTVFRSTDSISHQKQPEFNNLSLTAGWYKIEAMAVDRSGDTARSERFFQLTGNENSGNAFLLLEKHKDSIRPGDTAPFSYQSNLGEITVLQAIQTGDSSTSLSLLQFNSKSSVGQVQDDSSSLTGIRINYAAVRNNRFYTGSENISVIHPGKQLTIEYGSFRDKILPGAKETWTIKVTGEGKERLSASVLTGMYDASLDEILPHRWNLPSLWTNPAKYGSWSASGNFQLAPSYLQQAHPESVQDLYRNYDELISGGESGRRYMRRDMDMAMPTLQNTAVVQESRSQADASEKMQELSFGANEEITPAGQVQVRKNLSETAFFLPNLKTDKDGNLSFSFTAPEALTTWKWMTLAHTRDLAFGYHETKVITQKEIMVQPNAPRFLREGDRIDFSARISNLTAKEITGQVELRLFDAETMTAIDGWFQNVIPNQYFTAAAGETVPVSFSIAIPVQYQKPVIYRFIARSGQYSDGEEAMLPVVSNRILVTETLPLYLPIGTGEKKFTLDRLLNAEQSNSQSHEALTVEVSANPAWYAVQALPYLEQRDCECADQLFNRYYANALASSIARQNPKLLEVIRKWKLTDTTQFQSNLQKNQELKSVLLQETPWVLEAQSESDQKKNIQVLFDMVRMSTELQSATQALSELQLPSGAFVWISGGREDRQITQYIVSGIGRLLKLGAIPKNSENEILQIARRAIQYLDEQIAIDYSKVKARKKPLTGSDISPVQIQYLYARSFFTNVDVPGGSFAGYNYYRNQTKANWVSLNPYLQGLSAISLHRTGEQAIAKKILRSLKESSITDSIRGMYWKDFRQGYYWYQAPVESHALMIEVFDELEKDARSVNDLKRWLLTQKQTNRWRSSRATADAVYALLLRGADWLQRSPTVTIRAGELVISSSGSPDSEALGYMKQRIDGEKIKSSMGNISIRSNSTRADSAAPVWGAVYYQYFEEADKVQQATNTGLHLTKKLFVQKPSDRGTVIEPVNTNGYLKTGDRVTVRIELRVDRDMEYVHMKDMRSSSMEPTEQLSGYRWQGGLGYYQSTGDVSTNFFFDRLPKGTYVFEYPLTVTHSGTFSNGITSIQCLYAPEFSSHSEGIIVNIDPN